jgi:hypothetical protein
MKEGLNECDLDTLDCCRNDQRELADCNLLLFVNRVNIKETGMSHRSMEFPLEG